MQSSADELANSSQRHFGRQAKYVRFKEAQVGHIDSENIFQGCSNQGSSSGELKSGKSGQKILINPCPVVFSALPAVWGETFGPLLSVKILDGLLIQRRYLIAPGINLLNILGKFHLNVTMTSHVRSKSDFFLSSDVAGFNGRSSRSSRNKGDKTEWIVPGILQVANVHRRFKLAHPAASCCCIQTAPPECRGPLSVLILTSF